MELSVAQSFICVLFELQWSDTVDIYDICPYGLETGNDSTNSEHSTAPLVSLELTTSRFSV